MNKLAVLILTKNEEKNLAETIRSVKDIADEVVVIDSGSTDRTVEIAKSLGARVAVRPWDNDFSAQRNFALEQTDASWVLFLDADERPSAELARSIAQVAEESALDKQYRLQRRTVAFGTTFKHGVLKPDSVLRLFPRKAVRWVNKVHEQPVCELAESGLPGYLEHHTYGSWADWERKLCLYTTIWAQDAYAKGKRTSIAAAVAHSFGGFFKMLVLRLGFLDGPMGACVCLTHFFYVLLKYLKLVELQQQGDKATKHR